MGFFSLFKKREGSEDIDYIAIAEEYEKKGGYDAAIAEYEKLIEHIYSEREPKAYRHITKRIINCHRQMGNYEKLMEMWSLQYDSNDYGAKEMYELIKILEASQKNELVMKVYEQAGGKLARNRIDFLIKMKKIPEANALMNDVLMNVPEGNPAIKDLWMMKAKLAMSLRKWEEATKYLNKLIDRDTHNEQARKLKEFCMKQVRMS